jgi:S-DNA-T family DNA segregation ATPase FtsK/SpoIIIE
MTTNGRRSFYVIALMAFALFWGVALASRHPTDWPFSETSPIDHVQNYSGPIGSLLAWAAVSFWGNIFAWLMPIALFVLGVSVAAGASRRAGGELVKTGGIILLLTAGFELVSYTRGSENLVGWAGGFIARLTSSVFGRMGGSIIIIACLLILSLSRVSFFSKRFFHYLQRLGGGREMLRSGFAFPAAFFSRAIGFARSLAGALAAKVRGRNAGKTFDPVEPDPGLPDGRITPVPAGKKEQEEASPGPVVKVSGPPSRPVKRAPRSKVEKSGTGEDKIPLEEASLPNPSLLDPGQGKAVSFPEEKLKAWASILEEKLAYYNIEGKVTSINHGPLITTFEFAPAPGVKIKDIVSRTDDISLAMKARSLRLIAPIPGRSVVGIEVPNPEGAIVRLHAILQEIPEQARLSGVAVAIGVNVMGEPFYMNLCEAPHLLVAGTTGSGKSVCLHAIITSILMHYRPSDVRLLVIDPKMVEMNVYNGIPHLLHPVTNDPRETVRVFEYLIREMERRKTLLKEYGVKNIESFNSKIAMDGGADDQGKLPYIVLVVDELGDLVLSKGTDLESLLSKLSNMARAVGIHMVVATQRPSVDVIVGKTKANFPTRIAFRVASKVDSRTILDVIGAEKLLGRGDMLYVDARHSDPIRLHGALISEDEVERVVDHWKSYQFEPSFLEDSTDRRSREFEEMELDPLYEDSKSIILRYRQGSTSLLQRKLHIGYARAARLLDQLEQEGVVGPPDGSKPREVLIPEETGRSDAEHL